MTPADKAQAAKRLLDDPLAKGLLDTIEADAVEGMLAGETDEHRRHYRDTVLSIRALRDHLRNLITAEAVEKAPRPGIA